MRKLLLLGALAGAMTISACATNGGYAGGGVGYDYTGAGEVWYDGYYGPYSDGYWNDGGAFFFRGTDGRYYRDYSNHFRSQSFIGSQQFSARHRHD